MKVISNVFIALGVVFAVGLAMLFLDAVYTDNPPQNQPNSANSLNYNGQVLTDTPELRELFVNNFAREYVKSGGSEYCSREIILQAIERYGMQQIIEWDLQLINGGAVPSELIKLVNDCEY